MALRVLAVLLLLLALPALADEAALVGTWEMALSSDEGERRRHSLEITSATSEEVVGVVVLDGTRYPEKRMAGPDEGLQTRPFRARWDRSGGLNFEVTLGREMPTRYRFRLFPVQGDLVGTVSVQNETLETVAGPFTHGVLARRP